MGCLWNTMVKRDILLVILLLTTFVKGILWSVVIPVFQAPDENRHYLYIHYLAEFLKIPERRELLFVPEEYKKVVLFTEMKKAPRTGLKPSYTNTTFGPYEGEIRSLSLQERRKGDLQEHLFGIAQNYPPLYYILGAFIYRFFYSFDFLERFYAIRFFFTLLPVMTVYFIFRGAYEFFQKKREAFVTAFLVSFLPQFSFLSSTLNNDNLLILLITIFFFIALKMLNSGVYTKSGAYTKNFLLLGIVAGITFLIKPQALIVIPVGILTLFFILFLKKKILTKKQIFIWLGIILAISFIISGWWYIWNYYEYGSIFGPSIYSRKDLHGWKFSSPLFLAGFALLYIFSQPVSFLGEFGWGEVPLPDWQYLVFSLLIAVCLLGWILILLKRKISAQFREKILFLFICSAALIAFLIFIYLFAIYRYAYIGAISQARSYFSLLLPIFIFLLSPIFFLFSENIKPYSYIVLMGYFFFLNFASLFHYLIVPYYI